jgi:hypothetical protein
MQKDFTRILKLIQLRWFGAHDRDTYFKPDPYCAKNALDSIKSTYKESTRLHQDFETDQRAKSPKAPSQLPGWVTHRI